MVNVQLEYIHVDLLYPMQMFSSDPYIRYLQMLSNNLHKEIQWYIWFIYKGSDMDKMQFRLKMHGNFQYS